MFRTKRLTAKIPRTEENNTLLSIAPLLRNVLFSVSYCSIISVAITVVNIFCLLPFRILLIHVHLSMVILGLLL